MYRGAKELQCSPYVIRYIVHKQGWTRCASQAPIILEGVKRGSRSPDYYKSLDFSGIPEIQTIKRNKNG